jgi:uncharacterized protein (UPF0332 family)
MTESVITQEIQRGDESLKSAEVLMKANLCLDAMSRVYYAVLHYARALLLLKGVVPKSHQGVLHLFSLHYVKSGEVSTETGKTLARLQKFREESDYNVESRFTEDEVAMELSDVKIFRKITLDILRTAGVNLQPINN